MSSESVRVMVRCRPMAQNELESKSGTCVATDHKLKQVYLQNIHDKDNDKTFCFDAVYGPESTQNSIYEETAFSLVENVVEGYNGTIFAYGQTGSGKTHTMMGVDDKDTDQLGIIPRTFQQIISIIELSKEQKFLIRISYLEIYKEQIRDLMSKEHERKLELREHPERGLFVQDLKMLTAKNYEEMISLMKQGTLNRSVASTSMNQQSSRSHSIFTIFIEKYDEDQGQQRVTLGKLNLVDLAGSERQKKTNVTGDRLQEAQKINLSLLALSNVISALTCPKTSHIPYKDSKLTRLLQDSLGGNTKTIMIAAIAPGSFNYDETLSTLRYASRAKAIQNKPKINEDPKDALLREYADEIKRLREMLQNGSNPSRDQNEANIDDEKLREIHEQNQKLNQDKEQLSKQFQTQQQKKQELEQMIQEYEKKITFGGNGSDEQKSKYMALKEKLRAQREREEQMLQDIQKHEDEMLKVKHNY